MLKKIFISFLLALNNIRSHFFHTLLSVLGIVIGVGALVAILSLIDGMEEYARDQITNTTSLKAIVIRPEPYTRVDGINIRKDSVSYINHEAFLSLRKSLSRPAKFYLNNSNGHQVTLEDDTLKTAAYATAVWGFDSEQNVLHGEKLTEGDFENGLPEAIVSEHFAKTLMREGDISTLVSRTLNVGTKKLRVIGVLKPAEPKRSQIFFPIKALSDDDLKKNPPQCVIMAENVEDVMKLKEEAMAWLKSRFHHSSDFSVATNDLRVEQAAKGFQLFRVIMGLIVGISVLVGGIGVMNVLLISVTERTAEIGVRKAVGANKRDIVLQFLSESITISVFGSLIGLVLGVLGTMAFVPIVKAITEIPFQAAYTWNTIIVIAVLAVVVGVVFGTYPALRAARLDPVEAIRHE